MLNNTLYHRIYAIIIDSFYTFAHLLNAHDNVAILMINRPKFGNRSF